jgi:hypothetical protein
MPPGSDETMRGDARSSYAAAFSSALADPTLDTPRCVVSSTGKAARTRYNVYRNNVTMSLIRALASIYPAVRRLTGRDFFDAMARFHLRETPPKSPLLFEYGREFPDFIDRYVYARSLPWLGDIARIECAWLDSYHAADAEPLASAALVLIPPHRLADAVFQVHPATRIVRSKYSAVTIFAANRRSDPSQQIHADQPEDALITRPRLDVMVRHLPPGGAVFLESLASATPFGEATAAALEYCPTFDIAAAIAGLVDGGAFTSVSLGDR